MQDCLIRELQYRTSRSSGPGGQHVNKTESKVELRWSLNETVCLSESQKQIVLSRLRGRITDDGILILVSGKYRSQYRNKAELTERFLELIRTSLVPVKKRKPTKPSRSSVEKRIRGKKLRGEIKRSRRIDPDA